ncbi:MAG: FRG domain-containing protein [Betaproteobacteria bacterium]|nr:FRG domain-containing protein [Betaproteobacteria bacterium]
MSTQPEDIVDHRHFDRVPEWPAFAVTGDEVSGRVPVTRITSWRKLPELLEDPFFNRPKTQLIYRGHRRYDWPLTPSLGRFDPRNIITKEVAEAQLRLFRRAVRGRISDRTLVEIDEEDELWAVGQHHGLLTPLLDWTYSPYVALFFAFEKEDRRHGEHDNPYRAVYLLNKSHVEAEDKCPDVSVLEPRKDDHGRLVNQAGLFTSSAYDNTLENFLIDSLRDEVLGQVSEEDEAKELAKYICKIYIPNEERAECLRHLRMMNVHHASLFPDLLGAAQYCNVMVGEEAIDYRQAEIEHKAQPEVAEVEAVAPAVALAAAAAQDKAQSLLEVLAAHADAAGVEPARLELIAQELATELTKNQYVDWDKRESVKAAMRNAARAVMRRLGYPIIAREVILDQLLGAMKTEDKNPE